VRHTGDDPCSRVDISGESTSLSRSTVASQTSLALLQPDPAPAVAQTNAPADPDPGAYLDLHRRPGLEDGRGTLKGGCGQVGWRVTVPLPSVRENPSTALAGTTADVGMGQVIGR
jgi:hypothetical protein